MLVVTSLYPPTPRDGVALRMSPVALTESLLAGSNEAVGLLGERGEGLEPGGLAGSKRNDGLIHHEQLALIREIGAWVLERACRDLAKVNATRSRKPLFMSVNVSAVPLRDPDLCEQVLNILKRCSVPASQIKLEITETAVIGDDEVAMKTLEGLRNAGAQIALDDFGTGFASLTAVERLPIDVLKIDRSFVSRIEEDSSAFAIVKALVILAENLRLEVVAEGVETTRQ